MKKSRDNIRYGKTISKSFGYVYSSLILPHEFQQKPTEASATSDNVVQTEKTEKEEVKAVATVSTSAEASSGEKLRDALLCQICCDQPLSMVFLPCGHSMCCPSCATALTNCPLCRKRIEATVRAYFPFP